MRDTVHDEAAHDVALGIDGSDNGALGPGEINNLDATIDPSEKPVTVKAPDDLSLCVDSTAGCQRGTCHINLRDGSTLAQEAMRLVGLIQIRPYQVACRIYPENDGSQRAGKWHIDDIETPIPGSHETVCAWSRFGLTSTAGQCLKETHDLTGRTDAAYARTVLG